MNLMPRPPPLKQRLDVGRGALVHVNAGDGDDEIAEDALVLEGDGRGIQEE